MKTIQKVEDKAYIAFRRHQELLAIQDEVEVMGLKSGEKLYLMLKDKDYATLGCNTFEEYTGWSEVRISSRTGYRLAKVYRDWIIPRIKQLELKDIKEDNYLEALADKDPDYIKELVKVGISKLDTMGQYITGENNYKLLNMGATLSRSDLKAELTNNEPEILPSWMYLADEAIQAAKRLNENNNTPVEIKALSREYVVRLMQYKETFS